MMPSDVYSFLCGNDASAVGFDAHVAGSIISLGVAERANGGGPLVWSVGLEAAALGQVVDRFFPRAGNSIRAISHDLPLLRSEDEICLLDLLRRFSTSGSQFQCELASMIARRAQSPNHLWQDLGLRDRGELSCLMQLHFAPLAMRNNKDMKWKKFLYRMICRDAGYSLCAAPSCAECDDFAACFGDEDGESFLARVRRDVNLATAT